MGVSLMDAVSRYLPSVPNDLAGLEKHFAPVDFAEGELFLRSGSREPRMGFVERGAFRFFYVMDDGSDATRAFIFEGGFLASRPTVQDGSPSPFAIEALEDSRVLVFAGRVSDLTAVGSWNTLMLAMGQERLDFKDRRIEGFITKDAAGRYLDCLEDFPGIEGRVRQHHIASYLGVTPVTLSRIRRRLEREGRLLRGPGRGQAG
jgi:cAMP-binding proteins - catabolite gene activator and regulatory subunit of cAMP-dependent protein kinases